MSLPSLLVESELVVEEEPAELTITMTTTSEDGTTHRTPLFETVGDDDDDDADDDEDLEQTDLNEMTGATGTAVDDEVTLEFYSRMGRPNNARQQCLRYHRWPSIISNNQDDEEGDAGGPLWIHSQNRPTETDIPPCGHCGGPRKYEFQLMPQMLHFLLPKESSSSTSSTKSSLLDAQRKQALLVASEIVEQNGTE
eukprot:scaffold106036_cov33-Attheya_sp.AAC.1